jgi:dihydrofolate reductase
MTRITLIAAVGRNRVIGLGGQIPWHLGEDLAHFKATTMGHPLVMGRATFDAIGRPLPGRRTIVITRSRAWQHADIEVAHSFPDALALAGPADEVFVAGGGQVYAEALPWAHRMVLTEVDATPEGDTHFPEWDHREWAEVERSPHDGFDIVVYERR